MSTVEHMLMCKGKFTCLQFKTIARVGEKDKDYPTTAEEGLEAMKKLNDKNWQCFVLHKLIGDDKISEKPLPDFESM